jgi:hypothetical protein
VVLTNAADQYKESNYAYQKNSIVLANEAGENKTHGF